MSLGFSIFLIAVGAILRFAVTVHASVGSVTVNWDIIGDILMAAGVLGLVLSIWMMNQSRRRTTTDPQYQDPPPSTPPAATEPTRLEPPWSSTATAVLETAAR
jgi:hypothetical protein